MNTQPNTIIIFEENTTMVKLFLDHLHDKSFTVHSIKAFEEVEEFIRTDSNTLFSNIVAMVFGNISDSQNTETSIWIVQEIKKLNFKGCMYAYSLCHIQNQKLREAGCTHARTCRNYARAVHYLIDILNGKILDDDD